MRVRSFFCKCFFFFIFSWCSNPVESNQFFVRCEMIYIFIKYFRFCSSSFRVFGFLVIILIYFYFFCILLLLFVFLFCFFINRLARQSSVCSIATFSFAFVGSTDSLCKFKVFIIKRACFHLAWQVFFFFFLNSLFSNGSSVVRRLYNANVGIFCASLVLPLVCVSYSNAGSFRLYALFVRL